MMIWDGKIVVEQTVETVIPAVECITLPALPPVTQNSSKVKRRRLASLFPAEGKWL